MGEIQGLLSSGAGRGRCEAWLGGLIILKKFVKLVIGANNDGGDGAVIDNNERTTIMRQAFYNRKYDFKPTLWKINFVRFIVA